MTHQELKEAVKTALKKGEEVELQVLRGLLAAATNELIARKRKPTEELEESDIQDLTRRSVKQHKESIEQFFKANRNDLASKETQELVFLQSLLPPEMTEEEIESIVRIKVKELGIGGESKAKELGQLMGAVMKETKGRADGTVVKKVVEKVLA